MLNSIVSAARGANGLTMVAKALGLDAETIMNKIGLFEQFAMDVANFIKQKLNHIDESLLDTHCVLKNLDVRISELSNDNARLEQMMREQHDLLVLLSQRVETRTGEVIPAGDTWVPVGEAERYAQQLETHGILRGIYDPPLCIGRDNLEIT